MDIAQLAGPAAAGLAALLVVLAAAAAVIKAARDRAEARRAERACALRPHVIALAGGEDPGDLPDSGGRDGRALEETAIQVLPLLRGSDRAALVRALERRGVVERARRRTYSRHGLTRSGAAETLGVLAVGRALPELGRLLRDRDPEVRIVAARALGKLGGPGVVPFLLASLEEPRPVPTSIVGMALTRIGPDAAEGLRDGLGAPSRRVRALSATLLGQHGAIAACDDLIGLLADPDAPVRAAAAEALGRIGAPRAVEGLTALLDDAAPDVRRAAAGALGEIGAPVSAPAVGRVLDVAEPSVAWPAARALARMGARGADELRARADGDDLAGGYAREALALAEAAR